MNGTILTAAGSPGGMTNTGAAYVIGAILALLILVYLVVSLVKPEKF
jgi:K+-transporting ATPase KdpF subunit